MHDQQPRRNSVDRSEFYKELDSLNLAPLWEVLKGLVPADPRPVAAPYAWHWTTVRRQLLAAGASISAEEAERRVLVLENPKLKGKSQITDTLYAGLQLILPGEVAPAHRHTQSALRFVLEGAGGYTAVDGERTTMQRGDLILTPFWTWHDHGHDGEGPVIWMDCLDVPLVGFLKTGFREEHAATAQTMSRPEGYSAARYGSGLLPVGQQFGSLTSPVFNYPYSRTREALHRLAQTQEIDPHFGICLRYVNPVNGDWVMPTLGPSMRLLPEGFSTSGYRSTDSAVFVLLEGEASIEIQDQPPITMHANDVFAMPGWSSYRIQALKGDCVLFSFSDRPVHEKLGLFREEKQ
ncbi:gentisate 1,2-dioxygenase [Bradyrhizobium liaoningense]|uniref:gentisate 1,2-dioxygenase n=1 Tax=Bradyrhizobium liaoningense TaxID=43992 RepID=UPI001BA98A12|nr:gentisate 1,2-dioxygenase [Bradyrhizobium liaoningense]MBR0706973.1 gentisate 1,2-dioxygenase [Bradyrhizobium liaoningense]